MPPVRPPAPPVPRQRAALLARFFRGLDDPTRVLILELLLDGEKTVSELVALVGSPQGRVSSHLACLRWCGFMDSYRVGKHVYYRITDSRVKQLLQVGQALLAENAERVAACFIVELGDSEVSESGGS